ncbi:hypothetical protein HDU99_000238 [Rhizoclosmatium hyalinum]|nr:hypothetical protein HDU99_000238 [Rhizoclosmatium hyalinum]
MLGPQNTSLSSSSASRRIQFDAYSHGRAGLDEPMGLPPAVSSRVAQVLGMRGRVDASLMQKKLLPESRFRIRNATMTIPAGELRKGTYCDLSHNPLHFFVVLKLVDAACLKTPKVIHAGSDNVELSEIVGQVFQTDKFELFLVEAARNMHLDPSETHAMTCEGGLIFSKKFEDGKLFGLLSSLMCHIVPIYDGTTEFSFYRDLELLDEELTIDSVVLVEFTISTSEQHSRPHLHFKPQSVTLLYRGGGEVENVEEDEEDEDVVV